MIDERSPKWTSLGVCLGETIRLMRGHRSQALCADLVGWRQASWSRMETDASKLTVAQLEKVCGLFGVSIFIAIARASERQDKRLKMQVALQKSERPQHQVEHSGAVQKLVELHEHGVSPDVVTLGREVHAVFPVARPRDEPGVEVADALRER
jgi:hypothetical protein